MELARELAASSGAPILPIATVQTMESRYLEQRDGAGLMQVEGDGEGGRKGEEASLGRRTALGYTGGLATLQRRLTQTRSGS